jgi:hypothetical protein
MTTEQIIAIEEENVDNPPRKGDSWTEELTVRAEGILELLSNLTREANVRRIIVRTRKGHQLFDLPLYSGVAGVVVLGPWTALPLIMALVAECSILVERRLGKE